MRYLILYILAHDSFSLVGYVVDLPSLVTIKNNVTAELIKARKSEKSSFPYIRHTLPQSSLVKDEEVFQVIVIGGTVMRTALCQKKSGIVQVISKKSSHPPKFLDKKSFLTIINEMIDPSVRLVALNFAYPLMPVFRDGLLDGELISGSKENTFIGLIGQTIGLEISKYYHEKTARQIVVTTANDTICLLLSGLAQYPKDKLLGGIVGTGVNFAFFDGDLAINLEAANFDKFSQSPEGRVIDTLSVEPEKNVFEKEVSGAYLYQHYNLKYKSHELFNEIQSTEDLEMLSREKNINAQHARQIFDYSAALVAGQIAGILEFKKKNCIGIMEGSIFWKAENYKSLVETYLSMLTTYTIQFEKLDDDSIIGGAMLVG